MPAAKVIVCGLRRKASRSHAVCAAEDLQTSGELRLSRKTLFNVSETVEFSLKSDAVCENAASGAFAKKLRRQVLCDF